MSALPAPVTSARAVLRRRMALGGGGLGAGLCLLGALIAASVVVSLLTVDPNQQDLSAALSPPGSAGHLLGTDPVGRDVLAWVAGGVRTAVLISLAVVTLSALAGVAVGIVAGYTGGVLDSLLMRMVDLQLAVPPLLLFIAASAVVTPSIPVLVLLLSVANWVPYARLVRTRVQSERERPYVAAARLGGVSFPRLLRRHLVPSTIPATIVIASLQAGYIVLWESALSFLRLGVNPPHQSLGFMVAQGREELATAWWISVVPGVAIVLLVLGFNLVGDGLRDRLQVDPDELGRR